MFTRFLSFSLLLLGLSAFGQAFTPMRPFLSASATSLPVPRQIAGLKYWWVASDLTNSPVTNWTDRIQAKALVSVTNPPYLGTSNVIFYGTNRMYFDGGNKVPISVLGADHSGNDSILFVVDQRQTSVTGSFMDDTNLVNINVIIGTPNTLRWGAGNVGPRATEDPFDFLYCPYGASAAYVFTNGVVGAASVNQTRYWWAFSGASLKGNIYEMAIWTNTGPWSDSTISNLHWYVTNTYGITP